MKIGKKLWFIIIIKLCIMFLLFKLFLFPDALTLQSIEGKTKEEIVSEHFINSK